MMPKTKRKGPPLQDWKGFYDEFQNETPRAAVIIAAAFMDGWLRKLIASFMVDDSKVVNELLGTEKKTQCPLFSFGPRIKTAYCLGLISKDEYHDLEAIRKLRNRFAHRMHGLSFDDSEVVSWCNSLQIPKKVIDALTDFPKSHRNMFLLGVSLLAQRLALRAMETKTKQRTVPKGFGIAQVVRVEGAKK